MNNEPVAWNYDNGKWEVCVDGYAVWLDSSDFTHDASLQVAGDFVDLPQKFAYAEEIAKRLNNSLYTHPAELTDEEILEFRDKVPYTLGSDLIEFARAILKKAQEK